MLHSLPLIVSAVCALSPADRGIVERTFAAWTHVSHDLLRLPDVSPPPIVLVDPRCTYTFHPAVGGAFRLGGQSVAMSAAEHGDSVTLPNGARLAVGGMAFTSLYGAGDEPFFFAALPGVWAADPKYRDDPEDWVAFLTPVMLHELTHTRQLQAIMRALEAPGKTVGAADLDDDVIQRRYQSDSTFALAQRRETDLLYEAARTTDRTQRLQLIGRALEERGARHARFYAGRDSAWAAIETRFIDMEGVAQWSAYAYLRDRAASTGNSASALKRVRDNRKWWSQEYGLALYLALDATVTDWQRQVFPPAMRSAFDLLRAETVRAWSERGAARQKAGQLDSAQADYEAALALDSTSMTTHLRLARMLAARGAHAAAIPHVRQTLATGLPYRVLDELPELAALRADPAYRKVVADAEAALYPCRADARAHQLDFWVGRWNVFGAGKPVGTNVITPVADECALLEEWSGRYGDHGRSLSFFDGVGGEWRQTYVASNGTIVEYVRGALRDGAMQFQQVQRPAVNASARQGRLTFTRIAPDTVRQLFESSADDGGSWTVAYDLLYVRAKP